MLSLNLSEIRLPHGLSIGGREAQYLRLGEANIRSIVLYPELGLVRIMSQQAVVPRTEKTVTPPCHVRLVSWQGAWGAPTAEADFQVVNPGQPMPPPLQKPASINPLGSSKGPAVPSADTPVKVNETPTVQSPTPGTATVEVEAAPPGESPYLRRKREVQEAEEAKAAAKKAKSAKHR